MKQFHSVTTMSVSLSANMRFTAYLKDDFSDLQIAEALRRWHDEVNTSQTASSRGIVLCEIRKHSFEHDNSTAMLRISCLLA